MRYMVLVNGDPQIHTATVQKALQISEVIEAGRIQIVPVDMLNSPYADPFGFLERVSDFRQRVLVTHTV